MRRTSPCEDLLTNNPCLETEQQHKLDKEATVVTALENEPLSKRARSCIDLAKTATIIEKGHNKDESPCTTDIPLSPSHLYLKGANPSENNMVRLWLPPRNDFKNTTEEGTTSPSCTSKSGTKIDEYLARIPRVVSRAQELLQEEALNSNLLDRLAGHQHDHRCLNVLQGEVAHVSADHADIVVSADATTCHVVALRSTTSTCDNTQQQNISAATAPFVSLAHIDQAYDTCLENMIKEHIAHHDEQSAKQFNHSVTELDGTGLFLDDDGDEDNNFLSTSEATSTQPPTGASRRKPSFIPDLDFGQPDLPLQQQTLSLEEEPKTIYMELHIAGGYLDQDGLSQQLSNQIIARFDDLAEQYQDRVRITLSTAAVSSLNNCTANNSNKPKSRGLGIVTKTGQVFAVKSSLPARLQGPALEVRSARAFRTAQSEPCLAVIHDRSCRQGEIRIDPFLYQQRQDLNVLLRVPDQVLLKVASTSPEHESQEFCANFRRTLSFVNTVPADKVFNDGKPLVYVRSTGDLNAWEPHCEGVLAF